MALDEHGEKGCMFAKSYHQKGGFSSCLIFGVSEAPSVAGRERGQLFLGEQRWLWIDYCASSLLLLSFNLQLMKAANTMMVARCCLRTTK